jgi:uncharacterized protein with HEPN domain
MQSVQAIQTYVAGQSLTPGRRMLAVLRRFLVAGEAAAHLTRETCSEFPGIPVHKIVRMRNRVVHDYGNVDFEIVWETIQSHLPPLHNELERFFTELGEV